MSAKTKSTTLYPHPFSKAYWRDAASELKDTRMLVFAALMIAVRLAMKLLAIPLAPGLKINTAFLANALGAMVYGPVVAAICAVATDILGYLQNPEGVYFIPFVLTEVGGSVLFALFLYRAKVTPIRVMLSRFSICLLVNIVLQTPIYMWYYALYMGGKSYTLALAMPSIVKNILMFPIESVALTLFLKILLPITNRMGLTHTGADAKEVLKFTKKQLITLAVLFVVGVGCVCGYLTYYYNTTNLITKSQGDDRYNANTAVTQAIVDAMDDYDDMTLVTIVTKSGKKFLGSEMSYTAICYQVDESALEGYEMEGCSTVEEKLKALRSMSKTPASKAAEAGVMQELGTASVILNEKTGEIVKCEVK